MSERVLIRLRADGELAWLAQDAAGRALSASNAGAPPAPVLARAQRVIVLVPAEDVLLTQAPLLAGGRAQFLKALPFALEDQLASPVEDLQFAVPDRLGADLVPVALLARTTLRGWLERLATAGIRADALYAETQFLPVRENACSILVDDARALWRSGPAQAGACATADLAGTLAMLAAAAPAAPACGVYELQQGAAGVAAPGLREHPWFTAAALD